MKLIIVTDAWFPQVNGVVTSLSRIKEELERIGHSVVFISPDRFKTIPCPSYPEIRLALFARKKVHRLLASERPGAVHIATEGPLGIAARAWCLKTDFPFTTSFHTRFPEYVHLRTRIPPALTYWFVRRFHARAVCTMVSTDTLKHELEERGFGNLVIWSRGVDADLFRPRPKSFLSDHRPIFMYVGRVAVEKNIEAFLNLDLPGTKYVVGDGPALEAMKRKYPDVRFSGKKTGEPLAQHVAAADVFVFPSRTDTFGLVLIEALACGVPVAAYPVQGPRDIIEDGVTGYLNEDLQWAAIRAQSLDPHRCRATALEYTWENCARQFLRHVQTARGMISVEARTLVN